MENSNKNNIVCLFIKEALLINVGTILFLLFMHSLQYLKVSARIETAIVICFLLILFLFQNQLEAIMHRFFPFKRTLCTLYPTSGVGLHIAVACVAGINIALLVSNFKYYY
jgi:hypothetical protein